MQVFTKYDDLSDHYPDIAEAIAKHISRDDLSEDFSWTLGGDVHVVDTYEEYLKILSENDGWDVAEGTLPGWFFLLNCNNNAGGPSYYIPMVLTNHEDRPTSVYA